MNVIRTLICLKDWVSIKGRVHLGCVVSFLEEHRHWRLFCRLFCHLHSTFVFGSKNVCHFPQVVKSCLSFQNNFISSLRKGNLPSRFGSSRMLPVPKKTKYSLAFWQEIHIEKVTYSVTWYITKSTSTPGIRTVQPPVLINISAYGVSCKIVFTSY